VKITYDTVTDSISCDALDAAQTARLQSYLSSALRQNEPLGTVAARILAMASEAGTA
jgi:hypothetical protein